MTLTTERDARTRILDSQQEVDPDTGNERGRPKPRPEVTKDGGWGWMVVLGSCICHFFLLGINRSLGIIYLLLQERFNATGKETSLAASMFVSIRALGAPIASKLCDRFGCRAVTVTGGFLLCIGTVLSSFATNIIHVYITFGIIGGIGGVLVFSPSYIAVSYWFDKKKGKAMSFSTIGTGFGSITMAPTMTALVSHYGYFGTMLVTGGLMLNNVVGGALYRKPPKTGTEEAMVTERKEVSEAKSRNINNNNKNKINSSDETQTKLENEDSKGSNPPTKSTEEPPSKLSKLFSCFRSSLWRNVPFFLYCIIVTNVQGCIQAVVIFLPGGGLQLGGTREQASFLLVVFGVSDLIGRFVFGFIFDIRVLRSRRTLLYTVVATCFAVLSIVLGFMPSYLTLAVVTALMAFFEGGAHSQRTTNVTELVEPSQMSIGVGLVIFFQGIGNFYGPLVGGALVDSTHSFANSFIFGGTTLLCACILNALHSFYRHRVSSKERKQSALHSSQN